MPAEGEIVKRKREEDSDKEENGNGAGVQVEGTEPIQVDNPIDPLNPSPSPSMVGHLSDNEDNSSVVTGNLADNEDSVSMASPVASPISSLSSGSGRASADCGGPPADFSGPEFHHSAGTSSAVGSSENTQSLGGLSVDATGVTLCANCRQSLGDSLVDATRVPLCANCQVNKMLCPIHPPRGLVAGVATESSQSTSGACACMENLSDTTAESQQCLTDSEMSVADDQSSQPPVSRFNRPDDELFFPADSDLSSSADEQNPQPENSSKASTAVENIPK